MLIASLDVAIAKVNASIAGGNAVIAGANRLIVAPFGAFVGAIEAIAGRNFLIAATIPAIAELEDRKNLKEAKVSRRIEAIAGREGRIV